MHVYFMNERKDNVYLPPSYCNTTQDRFNLGLPYVCAGIEIQKQNNARAMQVGCIGIKCTKRLNTIQSRII